MDIAVFDFFEIKHNGEVEMMGGDSFEQAQKFAAEREIQSILFYANIIIKTGPAMAVEKSRIYSKPLDKGELAAVSSQWLIDRRCEIKEVVNNSFPK